ncbi:MAG: MFS transporter [Candidatus Heimdallarchaeota archaeon]|nr:MAG: MFS transporter [Candidatus Heimdallarchaeota archaeon]
MTFIHTFLGISTFPKELQRLSLKFLSLQIIISGIYLSYAWISLYYLSVLDSFSSYGVIVAIGMLFGATLDVPLGILADRFGQRITFSGALFCLMIYYLGLILATNPIQLLFLEIIVGIHSALLSGSFIAWFMNSWEFITSKELESGISFRSIMGNLNFAKTLIVALITSIGGILLQQKSVLPQTVFLIQALIAALGVFLGIKLISTTKSHIHEYAQKMEENIVEDPSNSKLKSRILYVKKKYMAVIPFFVSFSLLAFTSVSFNTLIFPSLLYEISSPIGTFNQSQIEIQFATVSLILISITRGLSDFIFALASRLSGNITSFIHSPHKGLLAFYIVIYPFLSIVFLGIIIANFPQILKLNLIILVFIFRITLIGLAAGLYWQLYLDITSSEIRSSQESIFNTIYLISSVIGYGLLGIVLESFSFIGALIFLFFISLLGILFLLIAKNPNRHVIPQ